MGYPNFSRIEREVAVNTEVERCASIMAAVGLELVRHRGDRDGHIVELRMGRRVTSGFGTTVCEAFAAAAKEQQR